MDDGNANTRGRVSGDARLTPFRRRVYLALLEVPRGRVTTYALLAKRVGCASARAVGGALRANPFAPDVPCHRVVAADLGIGGF
jgi:methylated-DNA-[protein]-cysteine S-methyltransferase